MLDIHKREELFFVAENLTDQRSNEDFKVTSCRPEIIEVSENFYQKTIEFLPKELRPEKLVIALEARARVELDNGKIKEEVPLSLITSRQIPKDSEIRMGILEVEDNLAAYESILAHELGHMVVEWPTRKKGLVKDTDLVIPYWSKSIYEGVADFFAVALTGTRLIGSSDIWFSRTIDDYESYESAKNPVGGTVSLAIKGLESMGLKDKFASYRQWINLIKQFVGRLGEDPYTLGTVLARHLYEFSEKKGVEETVKRIIDISLTGKEYHDAHTFFVEVSK